MVFNTFWSDKDTVSISNKTSYVIDNYTTISLNVLSNVKNPFGVHIFKHRKCMTEYDFISAQCHSDNPLSILMCVLRLFSAAVFAEQGTVPYLGGSPLIRAASQCHIEGCFTFRSPLKTLSTSLSMRLTHHWLHHFPLQSTIVTGSGSPTHTRGSGNLTRSGALQQTGLHYA